MGLSISLRSDHPSAEAVVGLWREIERYEDTPSMRSLGYPPHITLAIYDGDVVRADEAREALRRASQDLPAIVLTFDVIRHFEGPSMVVWASPQPNPLLDRAHRDVHETIDATHCRSHYRLGTWTPHCTLGTLVMDREAALAFASKFKGGMEVTFDALDCVSFPPLQAVAVRRLPYLPTGAQAEPSLAGRRQGVPPALPGAIDPD